MPFQPAKVGDFSTGLDSVSSLARVRALPPPRPPASCLNRSCRPHRPRISRAVPTMRARAGQARPGRRQSGHKRGARPPTRAWVTRSSKGHRLRGSPNPSAQTVPDRPNPAVSARRTGVPLNHSGPPATNFGDRGPRLTTRYWTTRSYFSALTTSFPALSRYEIFVTLHAATRTGLQPSDEAGRVRKRSELSHFRSFFSFFTLDVALGVGESEERCVFVFFFFRSRRASTVEADEACFCFGFIHGPEARCFRFFRLGFVSVDSRRVFGFAQVDRV